MDNEPRYWFRAKRRGWGWGLPLTWEGWLVLAAFFALVVAGSIVFAPPRSFVLRWGYITALCLLVIVICRAKGEPQRPRRPPS